MYEYAHKWRLTKSSTVFVFVSWECYTISSYIARNDRATLVNRIKCTFSILHKNYCMLIVTKHWEYERVAIISQLIEQSEKLSNRNN